MDVLPSGEKIVQRKYNRSKAVVQKKQVLVGAEVVAKPAPPPVTGLQGSPAPSDEVEVRPVVAVIQATVASQCEAAAIESDYDKPVFTNDHPAETVPLSDQGGQLVKTTPSHIKQLTARTNYIENLALNQNTTEISAQVFRKQVEQVEEKITAGKAKEKSVRHNTSTAEELGALEAVGSSSPFKKVIKSIPSMTDDAIEIAANTAAAPIMHLSIPLTSMLMQLTMLLKVAKARYNQPVIDVEKTSKGWKDVMPQSEVAHNDEFRPKFKELWTGSKHPVQKIA